MVGKTFRVFVSSTFSDFAVERDFLQEIVFPRLRKFCESHDCRFQAIDLRWGISEKSAQDHQTMRICLEEIQRCRFITPKPNFIVLLGDRYGWQPLPESIPEQVFKHITGHLKGEAILQTLRHWYKADENAVPPEYILQPRSKQYEEYQTWYREVEAPLLNAIRKATLDMEMPEEIRLKLHASAIHQEIFKGVLEDRPGTPFSSDQAFCFFRTIENLPQNGQESNYIDLDVDSEPDKEASQKLASLKEELEAKLPKNCFYYNTSFTKTGLSYNYIEQFCLDLFQALKGVISEQIAQIEQVDAHKREIESHETFVHQYSANFIGQQEIRKRILEDIKTGAKEPLVVYGESGSGKTALMAQVAQELTKAFPHTTVICRFIGATPDSINPHMFLENLVHQIAAIYKAGSEIPDLFEDLIEVFKDLILLPGTDNRLILLIDAVDQLSGIDARKNLAWLPAVLPANVHILLTTTGGDYLAALRKKISGNSSLLLNRFLELQPMHLSDAGALLEKWLKNEHRALQPFQRQMVLHTFRKSPLPLQLRLAFEEIRNWRSYQNEILLINDIREMMETFINRLSLDSNHGALLVAKALCYLTASRRGLTENELLDILNEDAGIKEELRARFPQAPQQNKMPVVIWSRLYFDLRDFLNDNAVHDLFLIRFFHRQMQDIIQAIYLKEPGKEFEIHLRLADYFHSQGYENERTLSELVYHLGKVAQNSGGTHSDAYKRLKKLFFKDAFLEKKFQRLGQLSPLLEDIGIVYEIAAEHGALEDIIKLGILNQQWKSNAVGYVRELPEIFSKGHVEGTTDMIHQLVKNETKFVVFLLLFASTLKKNKGKALSFLEEAEQIPISGYQSCWDPIMAFVFEGLLQCGQSSKIKEILGLRDLEDPDIAPYFTVFTAIKNDNRLAAEYEQVLTDYISRLDSTKDLRTRVKLVKYMAKNGLRSRIYNNLKNDRIFKGAPEFELFIFSELRIIRHHKTIEIIEVKDADALLKLPLGIEERISFSRFTAAAGNIETAIKINRGHIRRNHFVRGLTGILENLPPTPLPDPLKKMIAKDLKQADNYFLFTLHILKKLWPWLLMTAIFPIRYFIGKYFLIPHVERNLAESIYEYIAWGPFTLILIYYCIFKFQALKWLAPGSKEKTYAVTEMGSYLGHYIGIPFFLQYVVVKSVINPLLFSTFDPSQLPPSIIAFLVLMSFYFYRKTPTRLRFLLAVTRFGKGKIAKLVKRIKWMKKAVRIDFIDFFYQLVSTGEKGDRSAHREILRQILHSTKKLPFKDKIKALFSLDNYFLRKNGKSDFKYTFQGIKEFDGSDITGKREK